QFSENFPSAFKTRTSAGTGITAQNTLALIYNSESGYYNSGLSGSLGLADFGTRLKAVFNNIPPGVTLYISTGLVTFSGGAPQAGAGGSPLTVAQAGLTVNETGAYAPVSATQTLDGIPAAALQVNNGTATAIWEVTGANPLESGTYMFPLWISTN